MPRPIPPEPYVAHLARLPQSLDADLRRIADLEGSTLADLERDFLRAMVALYAADRGDTSFQSVAISKVD